MIWAEVKQIWEEGFKKYIRQWWNFLDFMMMSLYLCTFAVRGVAIYLFRDGSGEIKHIERGQWQYDEPILLSEGVFAVANVFSFARIIYLFQTNPYLGPLQISLGAMLIDIGKFFVLFFLILSSFAVGLHQLYWYYVPFEICTPAENGNEPVCRSNPSAFTS